ncbi:uncharacterized protein BO88DRAFT_451666 [Aspergillus vadensis CBS 113365]|uniref:Uncharacterized protein n=1 Tax=Aspergillus vadensis (strain CBS 113365 / IMI 142717 / IBT 24658) TaxID=1448311 RepID=A0A319BFW1_ASPVC|nr:hypothetical protein BO88DRAFT_451666 [Aspergillus vadensis CBS 113365]PYH70969.1 hypothetical protein BO88DRAFT_451666 [Aspergillus vadensis CBS 113365]
MYRLLFRHTSRPSTPSGTIRSSTSIANTQFLQSLSAHQHIHKSRSMNDNALTPEATEVQKQNEAAALASASVTASGKLPIKYVSDVIVDIPLAAAEGFRVLTGLYGDKLQDVAVLDFFNRLTQKGGELGDDEDDYS